MKDEEINILATNIISYVCNVDEDTICIGWQNKEWEPYYSEKIFYVFCDNRSKAELISRLTKGEIQEAADNWIQVVFPLRNVF